MFNLSHTLRHYIQMLDIQQLEIFTKVVELKSFSRAAREMYLTQPTISQHISALEHHLGTKLLDRMGKEVVLTKAGEILYRYATKITALKEEAQQALDHFIGKKSGRLILGASTIPGEKLGQLIRSLAYTSEEEIRTAW